MADAEQSVGISLSTKEKELQKLQINGNELVCRSWLLKRSRTTLLWKKLWFVLRRNFQLAIYKDEDEYKPLNIINLKEDNITVSKIIKKSSGKDKDKYQFALFSPKNKTIHLRALNEYDFNNWFLNLEKMLQSEEIYELKKNSQSSFSIAKPEDTIGDIQEEEEEEEEDAKHDDINSNVGVMSISSQYHMSDVAENNNDEDYFTSDNEAPIGLSTFNPDSPIQEENEEEILKEEQELVEEQSSKNKMDLERIKKSSESPDFMKDYLIQHYSYNSTKPEHIIQKGYLARLKNLNQWKKFFIILTNRHLIFYKIHNYSDTKSIDYENLVNELANSLEIITNKTPSNDILPDHEAIVIQQLKNIAVYPTKVIDLKNLVDVVELDPLSKSKQNWLLIITPTKRYRFRTKTEPELVNWLIIFKSFLIVRKKEIEFQKSQIVTKHTD